jgi:hypothetical protein
LASISEQIRRNRSVRISQKYLRNTNNQVH